IVNLVSAVCDFATSEKMVTFDVTNAPPAVTVTATPSSGPSDLTVGFSVTAQYPMLIFEWAWDVVGAPGQFEPAYQSPTLGGTTSDNRGLHTYHFAGAGSKTFTTRLRVTDIDGAVAEKDVQIIVGTSSISGQITGLSGALASVGLTGTT